MPASEYRPGIDVVGTSTDAVIMEPDRQANRRH
jgi:N-methylhydantoinase A/oxoprolinase/acetone carboxylase beta subunit